MVYQPGTTHPNYAYDTVEKLKVYNSMLTALQNSDVQVKIAVTLPGLANYAFERMLASKYPGIRIFCIENDRSTYETIRDELSPPPEVSLFYGDMIDNRRGESFLRTVKKFGYSCDLIFADFCGAAPDKFYPWVWEYLSTNGILGVTTMDRNCHGIHHTMPRGKCRFEKVVDKYGYGTVSFSAYRRLEKYGDVSGQPIVLCHEDHKLHRRVPVKKVHIPLRVEVPPGFVKAQDWGRSLNPPQGTGTLYYLIRNLPEEAVIRTSQFIFVREGTLFPTRGTHKDPKSIVITPTPKVKAKPVPKPKANIDPEKRQEMLKLFDEFGSALPEQEQKMFRMYYQDKTPQKIIAKKFGMLGNAGVSSRLNRASKRMNYLKTRPQYSQQDLDLIDRFFGRKGVVMFTCFYNTTCQTVVAEHMRKAFPSGNWNQVTVRYQLKQMTKKIDQAMSLKNVSLEELANLGRVKTVLNGLHSNLNILHEVLLPHFKNQQERRLNNVAILG